MLNIKLAHVLEYPADGAQTPQSIYMNATQLLSSSTAHTTWKAGQWHLQDFFFFFLNWSSTGGNKNQAGCNSNWIFNKTCLQIG